VVTVVPQLDPDPLLQPFNDFNSNDSELSSIAVYSGQAIPFLTMLLDDSEWDSVLSDPLTTPQNNSDHDLLNAIANFEHIFFDLAETCRAKILPNLKATSDDERNNRIDLLVLL